MGRITSFNVWDSYLPDSVVTVFAKDCRKKQGDLFEWVNFKNKINGQLRVLEPSSCKYCCLWRHFGEDYIYPFTCRVNYGDKRYEKEKTYSVANHTAQHPPFVSWNPCLLSGPSSPKKEPPRVGGGGGCSKG